MTAGGQKFAPQEVKKQSRTQRETKKEPSMKKRGRREQEKRRKRARRAGERSLNAKNLTTLGESLKTGGELPKAVHASSKKYQHIPFRTTKSYAGKSCTQKKKGRGSGKKKGMETQLKQLGSEVESRGW